MGAPRIAIAQSNFLPDIASPTQQDVELPCDFLPLFSGDQVYILASHEEWCYGCSVHNRNEAGLFPLNGLRFLDNNELFLQPSDDLVKEVGGVIRRWWLRVKELYVKQPEMYYLEEILGYIDEMLSVRKEIMSGDVPSEKLNSLRQQLAWKIDKGNLLLGLSVIVRQPSGVPYDLDSISVLQTYQEHLLSEKRVASIMTADEKPTCETFSILLNVQSIKLKTKYNCEVTMVLYDLEKKQFISDVFSFIWKSEFVNSRSAEDVNHRALFTSFSKEECSRRIILVTRVAQICPIENASATLKKNQDHGPSSLFCRQVYGFDFMDLSFLFHKPRPSSSADPKVIFLNRDQEFDQAFKNLLNSGKVAKDSTSNDDVTILIGTQILSGCYSEISQNRSYVFGRKPPTVIQRSDSHELIAEYRNDLFVTLQLGEFSTKSEKNVEARLSVVGTNGNVIPDCFESMDAHGVKHTSSYRSYVFYHQEKPCWMEQIKISLPHYASNDLHLKITFHSRKPYDKGKADRGPFALAHISILQNSSLIKNDDFDLLVYKIEQSHPYDDKNTTFMPLPQTKKQLRELGANNKPHSSVFSLSEKSSIQISARVCSNILTQNEHILNVLRWRTNAFHLPLSLAALALPVGETEVDMLRFLNPLLDSLFELLFEREQLELPVFDVFVVILKLLDEPRHEKYLEAFERYMELFSHGSVSIKLMRCLNHYIVSAAKDNNEKVRNSLKVIGGIFKVIVASKRCQKKFNGDPQEHYIFCASLEPVLDSIVGLMSETRDRMTIQNTALKYLPLIIDPILKSGAYEPERLCQWVLRVMNSFGKNIVARERLGFIGQIISTQVFDGVDCRSILLARSLDVLVYHLDPDNCDVKEFTDRASECVSIISTLIERMFPSLQSGHTPDEVTSEAGTDEELALIITACYRPVVRAMVTAENFQSNSSHRGHFFAVILALLNKMSAQIFDNYLKGCVLTIDKMDFVVEMLQMIRDMLDKCPFLPTWQQMIFLQNKTVHKALRFVMSCVQTHFSNEEFYSEVWEEYMVTTVSFITQPAFRSTDLWNSNDVDSCFQLRKAAAKDLRSTWFRLSHAQKMEYIPRLVGAFLEVALIEDDETRDATIPIFFDMMQCEFHNNVADQDARSFKQFSNELILQLDKLVNEDCGSRTFQEHFARILGVQCQSNRELWADGGKEFIEQVDKLLCYLFEYRQAKELGSCVEDVMSRTVQLMRYYKEGGHIELYVTYIYRLYELHMLYHNDIEAAGTLMLHANMLSFDDCDLPEWLIERGLNSHCATERQLKDYLLSEAADLYAKGQMWEDAIAILRQLVPVCETVYANYEQLASLLRRIADYFVKIDSATRIYFFYYLVAFYGKGFPSYLNGRKFVFRSNELERHADFRTRMEQTYGNPTCIPPTEDCSRFVNMPGRFMQVFHVEPIGLPSPFENDQFVNPCIKEYYRNYNIKSFEFSRTEFRKETKWTSVQDTDIMKTWIVKFRVYTKETLPGVLRCSEVSLTCDPLHISPLQIAVNQMEQRNRELAEGAQLVLKKSAAAVKQLQGSVIGVVQANVMGGIKNYEIFYSKECADCFDADEKRLALKLSSLVVGQVEILEFCLYVLATCGSAEVSEEFHEHLVEGFYQHKKYVEDNVGKTSSKLPHGASLHFRPVSDHSMDKERRTTSSISLKDKEKVVSTSNLFDVQSPSPMSTLKSRGIGHTMLNILSPVRKSAGAFNGNGSVSITPTSTASVPRYVDGPPSSRSSNRQESRDSISSTARTFRLLSASSIDGIRLRVPAVRDPAAPPPLPPRPGRSRPDNGFL